MLHVLIEIIKIEPRHEKTNVLVSDQGDTNRAVQSQKMARGLKFWIKKVEGLYYLCSENKGADQLRGYREADLRLCFRICWFSHDAAQMKIYNVFYGELS